MVHHEAVLWHPRIGIYMSPHGAVGRTLFEWAPILEEELTPYPSVALVLSSTWCIRPGYAHTLKRLPESLQSRFIGGTYHKRIHGARRRSAVPRAACRSWLMCNEESRATGSPWTMTSRTGLNPQSATWSLARALPDFPTRKFGMNYGESCSKVPLYEGSDPVLSDVRRPLSRSCQTYQNPRRFT